MSDVWEMHRMLQKERRDLVTELMKPHEEYFRQKQKEITAICEAEGHNYRFSHLGPLNNPWHYCTKCGKSKVDDA